MTIKTNIEFDTNSNALDAASEKQRLETVLNRLERDAQILQVALMLINTTG